jgi:DNA-binding transcriptional LysR family regulator
MDLKQLRYFVASAEEGNMGRAAKRLFIVQSALSRQIQELEHEVGAPLFDRVPRGVRLTEVGEVLFVHARTALGAADDALAAVRVAVHATPCVLRVAPPDYGAGTRQAAAALQRFRDLHPHIHVELVMVSGVDHVAGLEDRLIDIGFSLAVRASEYPAGITAAAIGPESVHSALIPASHALAARRTLALAELAPLPMLLPERSAMPSVYDAVVAAVRARDVRPRIVRAPRNLAGMAQLVAAGAGWAPVPESLRPSAPAGTVLRRVRDLKVALESHVLRRHGPREAAAAAFVDCITNPR